MCKAGVDVQQHRCVDRARPCAFFAFFCIIVAFFHFIFLHIPTLILILQTTKVTNLNQVICQSCVPILFLESHRSLSLCRYRFNLHSDGLPGGVPRNRRTSNEDYESRKIAEVHRTITIEVGVIRHRKGHDSRSGAAEHTPERTEITEVNDSQPVGVDGN